MDDFRRGMYRGARIAGDVQAIRRGPGAVVRRQLRKVLWKAFASLMRSVGL